MLMYPHATKSMQKYKISSFLLRKIEQPFHLHPSNPWIMVEMKLLDSYQSIESESTLYYNTDCSSDHLFTIFNNYNIHLINTNFQSVLNKKAEFLNLIDLYQRHVITGTETWLSNSIVNNKVIPAQMNYCIAGKFGGEKIWRTDSFRAFGERKFGELIDQLIGY